MPLLRVHNLVQQLALTMSALCSSTAARAALPRQRAGAVRIRTTRCKVSKAKSLVDGYDGFEVLAAAAAALNLTVFVFLPVQLAL